MKSSFLLILLVLTFSTTLSAQVNVWNGFVPLKAMRADVEKKIGKPLEQNPKGLVAYYETPDAKILVVYANGGCSSSSYGGDGYNEWDAPYNNVMRIYVSPLVKPDLAKYKFDQAKYSKYEDASGIVTYSSKEGGFNFIVKKSENKIRIFEYFPGEKDRKYRCPQ